MQFSNNLFDDIERELHIKRNKSEQKFFPKIFEPFEFKRRNSDKIFKVNHVVPDFGMVSPQQFRKSIKFYSSVKKDQTPMFNTTEGKRKESDQYSFGGASDQDEREPIENWQQLVNQREELRLSIMSIKNPKISRLSGVKIPSRVSEGASDGPGSPFSHCETPEKLQSDLLMAYNGVENARKLIQQDGGFTLEHDEGKWNRITDVIFFAHGIVSADEKQKVQPNLLHSETTFFSLPENTKVYEYYNPEEDDRAYSSNSSADKMNKRQQLIQKIQLRQELVRGNIVKPLALCKPGESCLDRPFMHQQFNSCLLGSKVTCMKITITQDKVDCGHRKIIEEIMLDKYSDFESFSFKNVVNKMRDSLEQDIFLRIHVINNFTFDEDYFETEADMMLKEREMEENQQYKRNSYLKLLGQFSNMHPVPTQNIDFMNIHQKNLMIQSRVEELQKTVKEFMLKNMKQNTKHQQELRAIKEKLQDAQEMVEFKQKKCDQLQTFITQELDKYKDVLNKSMRSRNSSPNRSPSPTRPGIRMYKNQVFPVGIEQAIQTDDRHFMVSQQTQYENLDATINNSSLSIQIDNFEQAERKDFSNIFNNDIEESHQVLVSNLSFDVEMSDQNRSKLVRQKIKPYDKGNDTEILTSLMNESYHSEIGLNGKPVVNTIQSNHDTSINSNYLQQSIEDSIVGVDASEKVIAFKKRMLQRQLEKQAQSNKKSIIKATIYQDATKSVNQSLHNASMASQKKVISSRKKQPDEQLSQVLNEQILYDQSVDHSRAQDNSDVSFSTIKSGVSGGARPTSPQNFRKGNKQNILQAIQQVVMNNTLTEQTKIQKKELISVIEQAHNSHFVILLKSSQTQRFDFKALYSSKMGILTRIYGKSSPMQIDDSYIDKYFKFSNSQNKFIEVTQSSYKKIGSNIDAVVMKSLNTPKKISIQL